MPKPKPQDLAAMGRALFLSGVFLMVTGDWPQSTLLPTRWDMPLNFLGWPWLYLTAVTTSFVFLVWGGTLRLGRSTTGEVLHAPLLLLTAAFLVSVACSQVPALSEWAFGSVLAVVGFTFGVAEVVEDKTCRAGIAVALAAAALCLAVRVIVWRLDEGLGQAAFHVRNTAWLGKIQISWALNLVAPFLLAGCIGARARGKAAFFGVTWVISVVAIYMLFSKAGVCTILLTTLSLCALNARAWRRWVPPVAGIIGLAVMLVALNPALAKVLVGVLQRPQVDAGVGLRLRVFRQTAQMIVDYPLVGIGLGTYDDIAYTRYAPIGDPHFFRQGWHAHNTALHVLAETGIVGFLAWCYLWFSIARFVFVRWRQANRAARLHVSAVLGVLEAFVLASMTEAMTAARLHASLRLNLTLALLITYGLRLTAPAPAEAGSPADP